MSLIKKIDVPKHYATRRAERRLAARFATPPHAAGIAQNEPAGTKANASGFIEDFSIEHSSPTMHVPAKS